MTEQELNEKETKNIDRVISSLKSILAFYESKAKPRRPLKSIRCALVVAIELCEKQIAKKPIFDDEQSFIRRYHCPECKCVVDAQRYCHHCGQKLDWGNNMGMTEQEALKELETHLSQTREGVEVIKARRIMERIKQMTESIELISKNLRNK